MKAFKGGLLGCLGVGAAIVLVIVVIAVLSGLGKGAGSGSSPSSSSAPHTAQVLVDKAGNGQWTSPTFTAPDEWVIDYTYDCAAFGQSGNFAIMVEGDTVDVAANQIGARGADTANVHGGGKVHLSVTSECAWTVKAKG